MHLVLCLLIWGFKRLVFRNLAARFIARRRMNISDPSLHINERQGNEYLEKEIRRSPSRESW